MKDDVLPNPPEFEEVRLTRAWGVGWFSVSKTGREPLGRFVSCDENPQLMEHVREAHDKVILQALETENRPSLWNSRQGAERCHKDEKI